jgi:putative glutamine amidotransferase
MTPDPKPLIVITAHRATDPDRTNLDGLLALIVAGVERAGGAPALAPAGLGAAALEAIFRRVDGVLLSGGGDVDPARYGAAPHPLAVGVDAGRDEAELWLARRAADEAKPIFGICRGAQVLNVALGGTLYGDVGEHPGAGPHAFDQPGQPWDLRAHWVQVAEGTRLARLLGAPRVGVNSLHHQAVRALAPGLAAAAHAPDGLVEAVELPGHPFALAVQWHPECLPEATAMQRLFEGFVEAAGRRGV